MKEVTLFERITKDVDEQEFLTELQCKLDLFETSETKVKPSKDYPQKVKIKISVEFI